MKAKARTMSLPRKTFNETASAATPAQKYAPAWQDSDLARNFGQDLIKQLRKQFPDPQDAMWLVKNGAALDATSALNGDTPLHSALRNGFKDMAIEMIKRGAPVNAATKGGQTPLDMAARRTDTDILAALLTAGALPTENALVQAIAGRRLENVEKLVAAGVEIRPYMLDFVKGSGDTPLHDFLAQEMADQKETARRNATTVTRDLKIMKPVTFKPADKKPKP